jgi:hypothetical protein
VEFVRTLEVCVGVGHTPLFTEIANRDCSFSTRATIRGERNLNIRPTTSLKTLSRSLLDIRLV